MGTLNWIVIGFAAFLGLRHLITLLTGISQEGEVRPRQNGLHLISLLIYWGGAAASVVWQSWFILIFGMLFEPAFRRYVKSSGDRRAT